MKWAYYNEFDPKAAAWLRELIKAALIADGEVDERSIHDVRPSDLKGFTQCHFFAGIGGWSYGLRLAGWPDDRPVWTGSCPCQPFSQAGKRLGKKDERHLWPTFFELIRECQPAIVFGEQVASKDGLKWLSGEVASLQEMRDRKAVLGILRKFERQSSINLQDLHQEEGAGQKSETQGAGILSVQAMAGYEQGESACGNGQIPGEAKGLALHDRPNKYSGSDQCRGMRVDGNSIRLDGSESVERAFVRPHRFELGLHPREHPSSSLLPECDGEHMGGEQDCRDRASNSEPEDGSEPGSTERIRSQLEKEIEWPGESSVFSDLENAGYSVGSADLCAAGVGAPHIRQRLYWVADAASLRCDRLSERQSGNQEEKRRLLQSSRTRSTRGLDDGKCDRRREIGNDHPEHDGQFVDPASDVGRLADSEATLGRGLPTEYGRGRIAEARGSSEPSFWSRCDWIYCRDDKFRPVEPGTFPLAHGVPARMGRLRGYGNAIVPELAATFVEAFMESEG